MKKKKKEEKYRLAIQLLTFEGDMLWIILSAYLIVNTLLLGFIGQMISEKALPIFCTNWPCFIAAVVGLVQIGPWLGTFLRNSAYYKLRIEQAKEVEPKNFNLLSGKGESFSEGSQVIINGKKLKMGCLASMASNKRAAYMMIVIFLIIYTFLVFSYGPWWCTQCLNK